MSVLAPFKLVGFACIGVGGTCSVVYAGSSILADVSRKETDDDSIVQTIADQFSNKLIGKGKSSIWQARLKDLREKGKSKTLDKGLQDIRDNVAEKKEADLQNWCEEAKINPKDGEEFKLIVEGVKAYCTYSIKDQASGTMPKTKSSSADWKPVNESFVKSYKDKSLSKELQEVYGKVKGKEDTSTDLRDWCFKKYDEPFEGRGDSTYREVSKVCAIVKQPRPAASKSRDALPPISTGPETGQLPASA